jgi:PAS domain S-box-containing protein
MDTAPTTRWAVYGGFFFALLTMALISALLYRSNQSQTANSQEIAASIRVTTEVDTLNVSLRDAETGQRGFLLTGDEEYLAPYNVALSHLTPEAFSIVASHATVDKAKETALLDDASRLTQEKLAELKQTINLRRTQGFSAAQKVVLTNVGRHLMTTILSDTSTVGQLEDRRVADNVALSKTKTASLTKITLAGNALTLALILIALAVLGAGFRKSRQDQEEIAASDERFKFLVRATNEAIWDRNILTDQTLWNDGIQNLFGYSKDVAAAGGTWFDPLIHPDDRERTVRGLNEALESREEIWNGQYRFQKHDGTYAAVLDRALIIRNASGKAVRMVGSLQDISEREAYEEKLKKRTDELERFNRLMMGRETRMVELKKEIAELKKAKEQHA